MATYVPVGDTLFLGARPMQPSQGQEMRPTGNVRFAYRESLELAQALRRNQDRFQKIQYFIIVGLAACGFGLLALRPRPTQWIPDLFLWTGVPFLAGFIAQLFRVHSRGMDKLAQLQREEMGLQLHADQVILEQELLDRGIYKDPSQYLENSERLKILVLGPEPEPVASQLPEDMEAKDVKDAKDVQRTLPFPTLLKTPGS